MILALMLSRAHRSKIISSIVGRGGRTLTLPSLTQTEAAARAALISVHEYRVVVDLTGLARAPKCGVPRPSGSDPATRCTDVRRLRSAGGIGEP